MNRRNLIVIALLIVVQLVTLALVLPLAARAKGDAPQAGAPTVVSYQGYLLDENEDPLTKNGVNLQFNIYGKEGDPDNDYLWQEDHTVDVVDGYFTVMLGDNGQPLTTSVFDGTERWLQIAILDGSTSIKLPRQRLAAVPYALQAANADTLDGHNSTYFATAGHNHAALGCRVIAINSQDVPNDTTTPLKFDTEINDTNQCWTSANQQRLYAETAGYYMAGGAVSYQGSAEAAARIFIAVQQNGETYLQSNEMHTVVGQNGGPSVATGMFYMDANDYIEIIAYQNLGVTKSTYPATTDYQHITNAWLVKVGE